MTKKTTIQQDSQEHSRPEQQKYELRSKSYLQEFQANQDPLEH